MTAQEYYQLGQIISKRIIGRNDWKLADKQAAVRAFGSAILLDLNFADAYSAIGNVYYSTGDFILAEKNYRKAVELKPNSRINRAVLFNLLKKQGRIDEAIGLI